MWSRSFSLILEASSWAWTSATVLSAPPLSQGKGSTQTVWESIEFLSLFSSCSWRGCWHLPATELLSCSTAGFWTQVIHSLARASSGSLEHHEGSPVHINTQCSASTLLDFTKPPHMPFSCMHCYTHPHWISFWPQWLSSGPAPLSQLSSAHQHGSLAKISINVHTTVKNPWPTVYTCKYNFNIIDHCISISILNVYVHNCIYTEEQVFSTPQKPITLSWLCTRHPIRVPGGGFQLESIRSLTHTRPTQHPNSSACRGSAYLSVLLSKLLILGLEFSTHLLYFSGQDPTRPFQEGGGSPRTHTHEQATPTNTNDVTCACAKIWELCGGSNDKWIQCSHTTVY